MRLKTSSAFPPLIFGRHSRTGGDVQRSGIVIIPMRVFGGKHQRVFVVHGFECRLETLDIG